MNIGGRAQASAALDTLNADGGTNLWAGLFAGMESLRDDSNTMRKRSLLLLTDGQPSVTPPRGHEAELKKYLEAHPDFRFQLNTFGFGYGLDSALLLNLATEANGTFAFIPDAKILGTCFVNSIANAVCTYSQKSTLHLLLQNGAEFAGPVLGNLSSLDTTWGRVVDLGPLLSGTTRDVVVPISIPANIESYLEAIVVWKNADGSESRKCVVSGSVDDEKASLAHTLAAIARNELVSASISAVKDACDGKSKAANDELFGISGKITGYIVEAQANVNSSDEEISALSDMHTDVSGRMIKSLTTKERFNRWGKHFLRAITRAHQIQHCTNFMDPGLQSYRGELFKRVVDEGGKIFVELPAPKRSTNRGISSSSYSHASSPSSSRSSSPQMQTYYGGCGGGCFGEHSTVLVNKNGLVKSIYVKDVSPGDEIFVSYDETAIVRCVVKIYGKKSVVCFDNGLVITPSHPIRVNGEWAYPKNQTSEHHFDWCNTVYNFVLDRHHVVLVNRVECVTWGHGFTGDVVEHAFYGTHQVIDTLSRLPGWNEGYVHVQGSIRSYSETDCTESIHVAPYELIV
jgi:hypothetical protein